MVQGDTACTLLRLLPLFPLHQMAREAVARLSPMPFAASACTTTISQPSDSSKARSRLVCA